MWPIFISIKYFLSRKREGMISFVGLVSILGIALGVAALIVVMSIMNGFDEEVKKRIIGTYSHIVILKEDGISDAENILTRVNEKKEIKSTAPFVTAQAILKSKGAVTGVLLKGIDPGKESEVTSVIEYMGSHPGELEAQSIVLGSELIRSENISFGDTVELIIPYSELDTEQVKLKVIGSFNSGRYDYDSNIAVVNIKTAQELLRMGNRISGIGLKVYDEMKVSDIKTELQTSLRYPYIVKSWMDLDKNLVAALSMEKKMMFIILALIIMVACFNVAGTLIMMVMEKTKDIGILKAIGASSFGINAAFLFEGIIIGFFGILFGSFAGIFVSNRVNEIAGFIEKITGKAIFPNDVYYFTQIPSKIDMPDIVSVVAVGAILTVISGIYPAWKASRKDPVEAIRYE